MNLEKIKSTLKENRKIVIWSVIFLIVLYFLLPSRVYSTRELYNDYSLRKKILAECRNHYGKMSKSDSQNCRNAQNAKAIAFMSGDIFY